MGDTTGSVLGVAGWLVLVFLIGTVGMAWESQKKKGHGFRAGLLLIPLILLFALWFFGVRSPG
jgi:membrane protein DedA with SNARE-associated domain